MNPGMSFPFTLTPLNDNPMREVKDVENCSEEMIWDKKEE